MRIAAMTAAFFLLTFLASGKPAYDSKALICYARALDVAKLDASLPSQRLDAWLREGVAKAARVQWRANYCAKKSTESDPPEGFPLCVEFLFQRANVAVRGTIEVGTTRKGTTGSPVFEGAAIDRIPWRAGENDRAATLSELPRVFAKHAK